MTSGSAGIRCTASELPDGRKIEIDVRRIFTNPYCRVIHEIVWRHRQIVRGGDAFEYASRKIIFRPVTGAEIAAHPICRGRAGIRLRIELRDAAKVVYDPAGGGDKGGKKAAKKAK